MRKPVLALATTAVIGLGSNIALASKSDVSGFVRVNLGATFTDFENADYGRSDTQFVFGGQGRANIWLDPGMSLQIDAEGEGTTSIDQYDGDVDGRAGALIGAHLSWRDPNSHLVGVFAGFQAVN